MSNPGMQLTTQGRTLLGLALCDKQLKFSRVAYGSGDFDYSTEKVAELIELKHWRLDLPIVGSTVLGDGTVEIQAKLHNFDVEEGFPAKEIGIYALHPDTGEEWLYAYRNAGDEYNFIPAHTGVVQKDSTFCYRVEIQDAANVTCVYDFSFAYASQADLSEHIASTSPHPNTPTHYSDVATTKHFWATDDDNHLHKISVDNAKAVLLPEVMDFVEKQKAAQADIENYRAFLRQGLSVGFIADNPLDRAVVEVTSCAKNSAAVSFSGDGLKVGCDYVISDGTNCELVSVLAVGFGSDFYRAQLAEPLSFDYHNACLYRFYPADTCAKRLVWQDKLFQGIQAGDSHTDFVITKPDTCLNFDLQGDWLFTQDGFFTLGGD